MTASTTALLQVVEPDVCGPLAVFPVLGVEHPTDVRSFAEAAALGASVRRTRSTFSPRSPGVDAPDPRVTLLT